MAVDASAAREIIHRLRNRCVDWPASPSKRMTHLVIRADGGPEIGYGHLVRSGAVAGELGERGHRVTYATTTPTHVAEVCPDLVETVSLPARDDPSPFVSWLDDIDPDGVFTDAYPVDTEYQRAIRKRTPLVVTADDTRDEICADGLVNGNLYAPDLNYKFTGPPPQTYLGPDYVPLRTEITEYAEREPPRRETPRRALVMMGGSDIAGLTPTLLRAFDGWDLRIDAIVGPGVSDRTARATRQVADQVSPLVEVVADPPDLAERMHRADFAVTTASSGVYELLALGTPLVAIPVAENQRPIANSLRQRDIAMILDQTAGYQSFREAIASYMTDTALRYERLEAGRELVDARGTERIADVVSGLADDTRNDGQMP